MKKCSNLQGELLHVGDRVWYKRAEFCITRIYRNRYGVITLELNDDVIANANDVSKNKPRSRFTKEKGE